MVTITRFEDIVARAAGLALPRAQHQEMAYLVDEALNQPFSLTGYTVCRRLAALFPERTVLQVADFDLEEYARDGQCALHLAEIPFAETLTHWHDPAHPLETALRNAWLQIDWRGNHLEALQLSWGAGEYEVTRYFLIAADRGVADRFYASACAWNNEVRGEVLVYEGHGWRKDTDLFAAIAGASLESLVLPGALKQEIVGDLTAFFDARATYERYGVPWKRGILFLGPPGNGKTHAVKGIAKALGKPCLYVRNMAYDHAIGQVFAQARRSAPCLLVLEDLDSLVKNEHRSLLLNELDGFAANTGIVTLATTNHPERLDPALIERPSRFDRKYHFGLPALVERQAYLVQWAATLQQELQPGQDAVADAAARTEGFSYAYLKELCVSALMRWMVVPMAGAMDLVLDEQLTLLREQMKSTAKAAHKKG